jgi:SAM-dependent methyltransferase
MTRATDSKQRFSNRVADYVRYRPSYPPAAIDLLRAECGLGPDSSVADIGSGTGILTKLLLETGAAVCGVEPNAEMREAGEDFLRDFPRFQSVAGSAESTTLPDASANVVTAGQAFHWFERESTRREWARILKSGGWAVLTWNERAVDASPVMAEYEELIQRYGIDYSKVQHTYSENVGIGDFFAPSEVHTRDFPNRQGADWDGFKGRLMSSSYAPSPDDSRHEPLIDGLRKIFSEHQKNGCVTFEYRTRVYWGHLAPRNGRKA